MEDGVIFIGAAAPKSACTILRRLKNNLNPNEPRRTNKIRPARAGRLESCGPSPTIGIVRPEPDDWNRAARLKTHKTPK
jgi:hypothetical protein